MRLNGDGSIGQDLPEAAPNAVPSGHAILRQSPRAERTSNLIPHSHIEDSLYGITSR
jgi:hypothetical protein